MVWIIVITIISLAALIADDFKEKWGKLNIIILLISGIITYIIFGHNYNSLYILDFTSPLSPYGEGTATAAIIISLIPGIIITGIPTLIRNIYYIIKERF